LVINIWLQSSKLKKLKMPNILLNLVYILIQMNWSLGQSDYPHTVLGIFL